MSQNKTAVSKATAKHRPTGWGRGHSRESPWATATVWTTLAACVVFTWQLRLEVAAHRYRTEDISLAKAAELAGVSWQRMREILLSRGVQLRLGPETKEEALEEVVALRRHLDASSR